MMEQSGNSCSDNDVSSDKSIKKRRLSYHSNGNLSLQSIDKVGIGAFDQTKEIASSSTWKVLPDLIIDRTCDYLDNDSLMEASTVSKQLNGIAKNKIVRIFEIRRRKFNDPGLAHYDTLTTRFLRNMSRYLQDPNTNRIHQGFHRVEVHDVPHFVDPMNYCYDYFETLANGLHLDGVVSLQMSLPSRSVCLSKLPVALSMIFPNLRRLDCYNLGLCPDKLEYISINCPLLEQIKGSNNNFHADGHDMRSLENLKEVEFDCCYISDFINHNDRNEVDEILDLDNHPNIHLFHKCSKSLERVSIRNLRLWNYEFEGSRKISQDALIKFFRNAPPSLKWFRSDLSQQNMDMLRSERPEIELLN